MSKLIEAKDKTVRFLQTGIWHLSTSDMSRPKALLLKPLQVLLLALQGYVRDNCDLRASALTFYSLLSVVPVVALAFGIAKGFGLEERLEAQMVDRFLGQEEVMAQIIGFARTWLEKTQGEVVAGIGVIFLFWAGIKVLGHIESALNEIWKVPSRSSVRKFTDYLTIMIVSPLLVIISSSVNVFISTQVTEITDRVTLLEIADPAIVFLLQLLPYILTWMLFVMIFLVMPNVRVKPSSAIIGGIIAGTLFQLLQGGYIYIQVLLSRYNVVYGSFAALPFFLIWLQLSWMIVLFGAQIAYAHQHLGQYALALDYQDVSAGHQKQYTLYMLHLIIGAFEKGERPPTADQMALRLQLPHSLVMQLIDRLIRGGLVTAGQRGEEEPGYLPARDIHGITVADVLDSWDRIGRSDLPESSDEGLVRVSEVLKSIGREVRKTSENRLIKDL
jgi:membrane protein